MKSLRRAVRDYLALRRGLGFKLKRHERFLLEFVTFLAQRKAPHITGCRAATATKNESDGPPGESS